MEYRIRTAVPADEARIRDVFRRDELLQAFSAVYELRGMSKSKTK